MEIYSEVYMEITKYTLFLSNCRNIEKYGNKKENFDKNLEYFQSPNKNFFGRKMLSSLESCVYWNSYINNLSKSL